MVGASFLQLNKVRDACAEFLISRFHAYNVLGIRQFADSLSCAQLVTAAEKYIHLYFAKVALSDEFLNLSEFHVRRLCVRTREPHPPRTNAYLMVFSHRFRRVDRHNYTR